MAVIMALTADPLFAHSARVPWAEAYLAVMAFAFQIYADFSAYSDVARGLARLLGIDLMQNFDLPYFARNPSDFWRRWHISLSTWLRDYLYIPLGGNRGTPTRTSVNLMLTMLLGGLWHGAAWNYVWWGAYHGALLMGHRWIVPAPAAAAGGARWRRVGAMVLMFQFTLFGWLLFRCTRRVEVDGLLRDDSRAQVFEMLTSFRNGWGLDAASSLAILLSIVAFGLPLLVMQVLQYWTGDPLCVLRLPMPARVVIVAGLSVVWLMWGIQAGDAFIYFQF